MGLTPRHNAPKAHYDLNYLDHVLKANIDKQPSGEGEAVITLDDYDVDKSEMFNALVQNGYQYEELPNGMLRIK